MGKYVKEPTFKKQLRVKAKFTLGGFTGFPKNDYFVQERRKGSWSNIKGLKAFDTRAEAQAEIDNRRATDGLV